MGVMTMNSVPRRQIAGKCSRMFLPRHPDDVILPATPTDPNTARDIQGVNNRLLCIP